MVHPPVFSLPHTSTHAEEKENQEHTLPYNGGSLGGRGPIEMTFTW